MHQERRIDILTGRQVILAPGRASRPLQTFAADSMRSDENEYDPFLEGNEHDTPDERLALRAVDTLPNSPGWLVRVVPNRYPAVANIRRDGPDTSLYGVHDVVIECPDRRRHLADMLVEEVLRILFAWQFRIIKISEDQNIESISVFRNEGFAAGASLPHCHSQILATSFTGRQTLDRVARAADHQHRYLMPLFDKWRDQELHSQRRVVATTSAIAAVCPYASRVAWHTRFIPAADTATDFRRLTVAELADLAAQLLSVATALKAAVGIVDQNLALVLPPTTAADAFPWMLDFLPRQNRFAGFEMLTDTDILPLAPEKAADELRRHVQVSGRPQITDAEAAVAPSGYAWVNSDGHDVCG